MEGKVEENKRKEPLLLRHDNRRGWRTANISHATWYTTRGWSVINRTARPTYPLNSKSHPPRGCYLRHHHRNSLPLRENAARQRRHRPHNVSLFLLVPLLATFTRSHPPYLTLSRDFLYIASTVWLYGSVPGAAPGWNVNVSADRDSHAGCLAWNTCRY